MSKLGISLVAFLLAISGTITSPAQANNPPRRILSGWLDGSPTIYLRSVDSAFNYDVIKDVSPFWYGLTSESVIRDKYTLGLYTKPITGAIQDLRNRGLTILPTITDDMPVRGLAGILANDSRRAVLVKSISDLVAKYNYDGIDLDFEKFYAKGETRANWVSLKPTWVTFIKELSAVLRANGKLLSVTTPPDFDPATKRAGNWVYAWGEMGPHIDRLRIMAYDFSTITPGPIGPLAWTEDAVKYAVSQMPASKVYVGIPAYGRDWITKVEGVCPAAFAKTIVVGGRAAFTMKDGVELSKIYGGAPKYNEVIAENSYVYKKTYTDPTNSAISCTATRTTWYPDERSFAVRAALVGKYRLGGVAIWTFGKETEEAARAIKAAAQAIAPDVVVSALSTDLEEIGYGSTFNLIGSFKLPDKTPIAGIPVRLEIKNSSDSNWRTISAGITDANGMIKVPAIVGEKSQIRLVSEGSWERLEGKSAEKSIAVAPSISIQIPSSIKVGSNYQITGQIYPAANSIPVTISRNGKAFGTFTTDASGKFTFSLNEKEVGVSTFQAEISGNAKMNAGRSQPYPLLVR
jgi:spore germination protein YaaH